LGDPNNNSLDDIDQALLKEAETAYKTALTLGNPPASANIEPKVNFGLGQIYIVQCVIEGGDCLIEAKTEFEQVIQEYEQGNERIADLAAHAYARLALIASIQGEVDISINYYKQAIELASPHYQSNYYTRMGEVYESNKQTDLAIEAYREAIQIAEFYGDAESVTIYTEKLNELERQ
jgi:tetratricopeptide (TPR) repeat protein